MKAIQRKLSSGPSPYPMWCSHVTAWWLAACLAATFIPSSDARAQETCTNIVDLLNAGDAREVNGVIFVQVSGGLSAGSGNINPFVRLQNSPIEQGYNTTSNQKEFDEKGGSFDEALLLSDIPTVTIGNTLFGELVIDLNDSGSSIALSKLEIYCANGPGNTGYAQDPANLGTLIYDLDSAGDVAVRLNDLNSGSGDIDYVVFFPVSIFAGCPSNSYIYVFSRYGDCDPTEGGFEEFAWTTTPFLPPALDLAITKDDGDGDVESTVVEPGEQFTYTLVVTNIAPDVTIPLDASSVIVEDALPEGVTFVSSTDTSCVATAEGFRCGPYDLAVGGSLEIEVTVLASSNLLGGTTLWNTAVVSSAELDLNPLNNTATEPTFVRTCDVFIFCPPDTTVQCDASWDPTATGTATASGDCTIVSLTYTDEVAIADCPNEGTIVRTWIAEDNEGNVATCDQIITIVDETPPVLLDVPEDISVECDAVPVHAVLTAVDNCDTDVGVVFSQTAQGDVCLTVLTRVWTASDDCGNSVAATQLVAVVDTTGPVFLGLPPDTSAACDAVPAPAVVTVTDNCSTNLTATFDEARIDGPCADTYTLVRTWIAADECGNTGTGRQTIVVTDTVAPVISCPPDVTIECDASSDSAATGLATAIDTCDPEVSITLSDSVAAGACPQESVITRTWTATDDCGNSASCDQVITVVDTTAPVLTCPPDATVECDEDSSPAGTGTASVSDNCDTDVALTSSDSVAAGACPQESIITRTWTATDNCGNSASCDQVITVVDTTAPVVTCPPDVTVECDASSDPAATGLASATDNCDADVTLSSSDTVAAGSCPEESTITRTWTATDDCGNSASCDQVITVVDTTAPVVICPPDVTVECDASSDPAATGSATATDNCDADVTLSSSDTVAAGSCPEESTITRTWTATDDCGNSASCDQVITVVDTTAPAITCPADVTIECDADSTPGGTGAATATDNCDTVVTPTFTDVVTPGSCANESVITRTWTATDDCGNSATCEQIVTVVDTTAPIVFCPASVTIECDEDSSPIGTGTAVGEDNCGGDVIITSSDSVAAGVCPQESMITRTWTATDDCGNSASCDQVITVVDTTAPVITCPADVTVECDADSSPVATGSATATDNCDSGVTPTFSDVVTPGTCANQSTITRTWTVTDDCGNSASCDQVITVVDTTAPVITCPPDATVECDEDSSPTGTGLATGTDNCDTDVAITSSDSVAAGACPQESIITRTWTAIDDCGNSASCEQVITVVDTTAPVITCPADATVECDTDSSPAATGAATATDNCDTDVIPVFSDVVTPGQCPQESIITRTWTAIDDCGNSADCVQTITVVDTTAPVVICPADATIECDADSTPAGTGSATATDNCDTDVIPTFSDVVTPGRCPNESVITRTWTAIDDCGNSADCVQTITVVDTTAPVITCPPDTTIECDADSTPTGTGSATATDNCDTDVIPTFSDVVTPGRCPNESVITRTWTAIDDCGNSADCVQTITVVDTTAPVITCPPDTTIECDADSTPTGTGSATATDNCDTDVIPTFSDVVTPGRCPNESVITRTWTAIDDCGNSADCVQTITVIDTTAPVVTCPADVTIECDADSTPAGTGSATATDNCDTDVIPTFSDVVTPGQCPQESIITRTWTASDDCGNSADCVQTITVIDTTAPVVTCPADVTIECDADSTPAGTGSATATDNCDTDVIPTFSDVVTPGQCPQESIITRTWTAIDDCGNSADCVQTITVIDTTAPVVTCPADVTIECDADSTPAGTGSATATDNCDTDVIPTFSDVVTPGQCPQESIITRTWTAIDDCGNSADCLQTITVVDTTPPEITCPPNLTLRGDTFCQVVVPALTPVVRDNCDPQVDVLQSPTAGTVLTGPGTFVVTLTATDACGNEAICSASITVQCGPVGVAVTKELLDDCICEGDLVTFAITVTNTGDLVLSDVLIEDALYPECDTNLASLAVGEEFIYLCEVTVTNVENTVIATATSPDETVAATNTITWAFDTEAPVLVGVPPDATEECDSVSQPADVRATDNCSTNVVVEFDELPEAGLCPDEFTLTRVWSAMDRCGNSVSATQVVTVVDTTEPVITCPPDVTIECNASSAPAAAGSATATDNCDTDVIPTFSDVVTPGQCPDESVITRTWTAIDDCGNNADCIQTITVVDTTAPVITCPPDTTIECDALSTPSATGSATATDNCDTDVMPTFSDVVTPGQCANESMIIRTWTSTDDCGNSASCDQVITVVDTTAPVITCPPDLTIECDADNSSGSTGVATATDNCSEPQDITIAQSDVVVAGACPNESVITRIWTATDECGNQTSCEQVISVVDTTAPVITCPADLTVECDADNSSGATGVATATDNCSEPQDITIVQSDVVVAGACPNESVITRTWTATDECGNQTSCDQIITVVDTTAPVITCPADLTIECDADNSSGATGVATATDNCSEPQDITIVESDVVVAGACPNESLITRTWTATDECGNQTSCDQIITVVDTTAPVITCPADLTIECDADNSSGATGVATATDNCSEPQDITIVESDVVVAGACPNESLITRTWTATDECGNQTSCDQIITVVDTTAPVITCPADLTIECDADDSSGATGVATATDNCSDPQNITIVESDVVVPGACPNESLITRTWTATDECGNQTSCDQIITVVDTTAPVITCPADLTIECDADNSSGATGVATATDNCSEPQDITIVESDVVVAGACPNESVITRTWTATDECGNQTRCNQIITVVDTTAPVITCPADLTVECDADNSSGATGVATATDNCSEPQDITIVESDVVVAGACPNESVITRTWTATDECGNQTSCDQVITVVDTTAPVITCPADLTVECDADNSSGATGAATATDNCSEPQNITIVESDVVVPGACPNESVITRTWTATDECGNQTSCDQVITVVDTTAPVITCPADLTVECDADNSSGATGAATATDNCSEPQNITIVESDVVVPGNCPNESVITRTWTATDECGNQTSCDQVITVVDTTAPVITCPADLTVECDADNSSGATGVATATDNCSDPQNITIVESDVVVPGNCPNESVITRTWTATDECGNQTSCDQVITVVDTTPPVITCPADLTVECDADNSSGATGVATASDNCSGPQNITIVESDVVVPGSCPNESVITRTWTATDECGNQTSCDQVITVVDTTAPVITCPADLTVECDADNSSGATGVATASDNCSGPQNITIVESDVVVPGSCPNESVITRTWTATDECGNQTSCDQVITVVDTTAPVITCPADLTVECDADNSSGATGVATATDNCSDPQNITIVESDVVVPGSCPNESVITRTWTATDECGNQTSCDQVITVVDTTPPVITCPADVTLLGDALCQVQVPEFTPLVSDNCDPRVTVLQDPVPGTILTGPGDFDVTLTAVDACGNEATCTVTVTVECGPAGLAVTKELLDDCICEGDVVTFAITVTNTGDMVLSDIVIEDAFYPECNTNLVNLGNGEGMIYLCDVTVTNEENTVIATAGSPEETVSATSTIFWAFDTEPPVLVGVPPDVTVECDGVTLPPEVTATDNCATNLVVEFDELPVEGACPDEFTLTRVWSAMDRCGNSVSATQVVTVVDTTAPIVTCPADVTIECDADSTPTATGSATATDNCDEVVTPTFSDVVTPGPCANESVVTRTWTALDDCGNSASCDQIITVVDTTAPVITCPADATIECDADSTPTATGSATATDNCDEVVTPTFSDVVTPGPCANESVITRTWTALDDCGNSASCDQIITVVDTTAPVIFCPASVTIECDEDRTPTGTGSATAEDNCDEEVMPTFSDAVTPGQCANESVITRTWTALDDCGNSASCNQIITVVDTTPPVITCPADVTVECDASTEPLATGSATATDNCDEVVTPTFSDVVTPGQCANESVITRTWTATDDCGNSASCDQIITVVDTTAPVITCPADATIECDVDSTPTATGSATATDNCDEVVTPTFSDVVTPGPCANESVITRTWTALDDCGNSASCDQIITVVDTTAPVITCPPDSTIECDADSTPTATGSATATDNCDEEVTPTFSDVVTPGPCANESVITRTWTATDDCGNSASCDQIITVVDTTAPVITCPPDSTIECDADSTPTATGSATATDNCDEEVTPTFSDVMTPGRCANESVITRTWTAADDCGNSASCDQIITVVDTTPPVITCPADTTVECDAPTEPLATGSATATDNCDEEVTPTFSDVVTPGQCANESVITRTWTATDDCGNSASCDQIITVVDTTPPVITCPADVTVECDADLTPTAIGSATAEDNCDDEVIPTFSDAVTPGPCANESVITRTWTATDDCGNSASCDQIITVVDTAAPVITCPADTTVECDADSSPTGTGSATATDNCDTEVAVTFEDAVGEGDCPQASMITRTWTATDDCGNSASCVQVITVVDTTPPVITCPADTTVECDASTEPIATGSATATDNCDPEVTVTYLDAEVPGDCVQERVITRTWTATDDCGNSASCQQIISVIDSTPPEIVCPPDQFVLRVRPIDFLADGSCIARVPDVISAVDLTATDNCDDNVELIQIPPENTVFTNSITITVIAVDDCGNEATCEVLVECDGIVDCLISGMVFIDVNGSGDFQDGVDDPLSNVVAQLFAAADPSNAVAETTTTVDGVFEFPLQPAGTYFIELDASTLPPEVVPSAWTENPTAAFAYSPVDAAECPAFLFGYRYPCDIAGVVWFDANGNGVPDEAMAQFGINGVTVYLERADGTPIDSVLSADGLLPDIGGTNLIPGVYLFEKFADGLYKIIVDLSSVPANLLEQITGQPSGPVTPVRPTTSILYDLRCDQMGSDAPEDPNFGFLQEPTPVELMTFTAEDQDTGSVLIRWETAVETENIGYNVYRSETRDGPRNRVNADFILGQGSSIGRAYELVDATVVAGQTYYYWLEDIDWNFASTIHGPAVVDSSSTLAVVTVEEAGLYMIEQPVLEEAGVGIDAAELMIYVDGEEVALYITASHGPLAPDDYLVFYVPGGGSQVEVRRGADALRMEEVEAAPRGGGDVYYDSASTRGTAAFAVDKTHTRYLVVGFTEEPVLVLDISEELLPKLLYGYAVLDVSGELGAYLGYTEIGAKCIAADGPGLRRIGQLGR